MVSSCAAGGRLEAPVEAFLELGDRAVEVEDLGCEGIVIGKRFCTEDSFLPAGFSHASNYRSAPGNRAIGWRLI
jgi:hypothetical protein